MTIADSLYVLTPVTTYVFNAPQFSGAPERRGPESICLSEEVRWTPDPPDQVRGRGDGEWDGALAAFEAARAAVWEIEAATAGYALEDEEALLPAHDAACEAMEAALQHMLFVPAPDLRALGIKFEAAFDHELASSVRHGELRYPAILQDIIRLWGASRRPAASGTRQRGPR